MIAKITSIMLDHSPKIETIIWDVDQTLYSYWGDLADAFSHYTALSARKHINKSPRPSIDALTDIARQSYCDHSLTTRIFAEKYDIDELTLYRDHHTQMIQDLVEPVLPQRIMSGEQESYKDLFNYLVQSGVQNIALTHGTTQWAEDILSFIGVRECFSFVRGIDAYDLRLKNESKRLWTDYFNEAGIKPHNVYGDYSHVRVVEDSPANLRIPKDDFNMQTTLLKTARISVQEASQPFIDTKINNVKDVKQISIFPL